MHTVGPQHRIAPDQFVRTVNLVAGLEDFEPDPNRRAALAAVLAGTQERLVGGADAGQVLAAIPALFSQAMEPFGWMWNGIYYLGADGRLHLGPAQGPPVCSELERRGGILTSGMCFDCLALNQLLLVADVSRWPGYVSCDAESGLRTKGGISCPLRDPSGRALGVWDLDATETVTAGDGRFVGALFSTLASTLDFGTCARA